MRGSRPLTARKVDRRLSTAPPDCCITLVDWWDSFRLDGYQLHRSADAIGPGAFSEGGLSLDEHRLREHSDCVSCGVFAGADVVRPHDRPGWHETRADAQRYVVLDCVVVDFAGEWIYELCA